MRADRDLRLSPGHTELHYKGALGPALNPAWQQGEAGTQLWRALLNSAPAVTAVQVSGAAAGLGRALPRFGMCWLINSH